MMKIRYTSNFSWAKMYSYITKDKDFEAFITKVIVDPVVEDSKKTIRENKVKPATLKRTIERRRARKNPKTISDYTLYDTGALHDSIKISDIKGKGFVLKGLKQIEFMQYGAFHQLGLGDHKKRKFIKLSIKNADEISRKLTSRLVRSFKKRLSK